MMGNQKKIVGNTFRGALIPRIKGIKASWLTHGAIRRFRPKRKRKTMDDLRERIEGAKGLMAEAKAPASESIEEAREVKREVLDSAQQKAVDKIARVFNAKPMRFDKGIAGVIVTFKANSGYPSIRAIGGDQMRALVAARARHYAPTNHKGGFSVGI